MARLAQTVPFARIRPHLDGDLLRQERHRALLDGLAELPPHHRDLLIMLATDPPLSYAEISHALGIPIGSIGPTRSRVLGKLRETGPIRRYLQASPDARPSGGGRHVLAEME